MCYRVRVASVPRLAVVGVCVAGIEVFETARGQFHNSPARCSGVCVRGRDGREPPSPTTAIHELPASSLRTGELIFATDEPKMIHNAATHWGAATRWVSPAALAQHYGHLTFDVSAGKITLAEFLSRRDETYLVETMFDGDRAELLTDYARPPAFADTLDEIPGTSSRPHWFVGGARTGSMMHQDTRCTCGWNACLFGCKRWLMLPPDTDVHALGLMPYSKSVSIGLPTTSTDCSVPRPTASSACASASRCLAILFTSLLVGIMPSST